MEDKNRASADESRSRYIWDAEKLTWVQNVETVREEPKRRPAAKDTEPAEQYVEDIDEEGTIEAIYELEGSSIRQSLMRAVEEAAKKTQLIREQLSINSR